MIYVSAINSIIVSVMNAAAPATHRGCTLYRPSEMKIHPIDTAISVAEKVIPGMITENAVTRLIFIPAARAIRTPPEINVLKTAVLNGPSEGRDGPGIC